MIHAETARANRPRAWAEGTTLTALALLALAAGDPLERAASGLIFVVVLCLFYASAYAPPGRYSLEHGTLLFGRERIPLSRVSAARVEARPRFLFFPEMVLRIETSEGERALPLTYTGWETVYEALRTARPDLGLPPWWAEAQIQRALKRQRPSIRVPNGVRRYRENGTQALFVAATLWLALILVGNVFPLSGLLNDLWIALVVYAALTIYDRLAKPVVVVEDEAGRLHTL